MPRVDTQSQTLKVRCQELETKSQGLAPFLSSPEVLCCYKIYGHHISVIRVRFSTRTGLVTFRQIEKYLELDEIQMIRMILRDRNKWRIAKQFEYELVSLYQVMAFDLLLSELEVPHSGDPLAIHWMLSSIMRHTEPLNQAISLSLAGSLRPIRSSIIPLRSIGFVLEKQLALHQIKQISPTNISNYNLLITGLERSGLQPVARCVPPT